MISRIVVAAKLGLIGCSLFVFVSTALADTEGAKKAEPTVSPSDRITPEAQTPAASLPDADVPKADVPKSASSAPKKTVSDRDSARRDMLFASLTIFVLAIFVGFEVITKVPPTLHTPLMSGSNAISGITIVGALIIAGHSGHFFVSVLGFFAVALAAVNVVGGFLVTHRMLAMFKKR